MDISNEKGNVVSDNIGDTAIDTCGNINGGDIGNNNVITIQQNNPKTGEQTRTEIILEDSNADLISILKLQVENLHQQLREKDKQIKSLIEMIDNKK